MSWRVVLTGPECTGKTTLSLVLADRLGATWVPEVARAYAEAHGGALSAADVEPIATATCDELQRAYTSGDPLIVADTDLVSTMVYARAYYGACPAWIEEQCGALRAELYLLCTPDLPWEPDGVRDQPELADRTTMHAAFNDALRALGAHVVRISGSGEERVEAALRAVRAALPAELRR